MAIASERRLWRRPRASLRTLLIVFAVITIPLASKANQLARRQQAVRLLDQWNHDPLSSDYSFYDRLPWRLLPVETDLWLEPCLVTYAAVQHYDACHLETVPALPVDPAIAKRAAQKCRVLTPTDAERRRLMAAVATLPELEYLHLLFELDAHDLVELEGLRSLEMLGFRVGILTDDVLAGLLKLRTVSSIHLHCMFPDRLPVECIAKLRSHPNLKRLEIWGDFRHDDGDTQRIKAELPGIVVEIR